MKAINTVGFFSLKTMSIIHINKVKFPNVLLDKYFICILATLFIFAH